MRRLWVVSPVYLDVESYLLLRTRLMAVIAADPALTDLDLRLVVADDSGGLDPEMAILREHQDVLVVEPPFNLGHQRAIVYALRTIAGRLEDDDLVVTMDADGEDAPADVPRLLAELLNASSDRVVVLALRTKRLESRSFKVLYFAFRTAFRLLTGTFVRSGNFAAYRGWVVRRVLAHPNFDLCYSSTLTSLNLATCMVPCERATRLAGQSRMDFPKLVGHGIGMLMPYIDRIAIRALILFSTVMGACFLLALAVVGVKLGTDNAIPGWATSSLLALMISSLVALGNFVILFAVYSQSRGLSLSELEDEDRGSTRSTSAATDRTLS
jgi:polyisoprenyl-phosphate glycosyltransferase